MTREETSESYDFRTSTKIELVRKELDVWRSYVDCKWNEWLSVETSPVVAYRDMVNSIQCYDAIVTNEWDLEFEELKTECLVMINRVTRDMEKLVFCVTDIAHHLKRHEETTSTRLRLHVTKSATNGYKGCRKS